MRVTTAWARAFWNAGYKLHAHTNGDKSAAAFIELLRTLQAEKPRPDHRFTLEHFAYSSEDQSRQLKALGAVVFRDAEARARLGLDENKTYVLFLAANALRDRRKGLDLVVEALERFSPQGKVELLVVGSHGSAADLGSDLPATFLGPVSEDDQLVAIYSAANVFALPSRQDNLPNTAVEALA